MKNYTVKEKEAIRKKIRQAMRKGTFTQSQFARENYTTKGTVSRLISRDTKLAKEYAEYIAKQNRKQKQTIKGSTQNPEKPFVKEVTKSCDPLKGLTITTRSLDIKTVEDLLRIAEVDMDIWQVDRHLINSWEVTIGGIKTGTDQCETFTNFQVKVWMKRKSKALTAIETIYKEIKNHSLVVPKIKRVKLPSRGIKRELEISLMDLHLGLRCYKPASDINYSPEIAASLMMTMLDELLERSRPFGQYEKIILVFGNDYLHSDNVYNTTTSFTSQPEADAWQNTFEHGERLGFAMVERLVKEAPVKVISVPGNHARHSEIALGKILAAKYDRDKNIEVDAGLSPYKFHSYGVNLIGFEHGHSIRQQVRLAALMANETRLHGVWEKARYCEWHLGDQHRKASGKPMHFEEQGVSVEFLPALVPPNEWHRIHSFNWQKRAGMAFVWDKTAGPIGRFQVNVDNYSGKIMK